jgi:hypothetical protein
MTADDPRNYLENQVSHSQSSSTAQLESGYVHKIEHEPSFTPLHDSQSMSGFSGLAANTHYAPSSYSTNNVPAASQASRYNNYPSSYGEQAMMSRLSGADHGRRRYRISDILRKDRAIYIISLFFEYVSEQCASLTLDPPTHTLPPSTYLSRPTASGRGRAQPPVLCAHHERPRGLAHPGESVGIFRPDR